MEVLEQLDAASRERLNSQSDWVDIESAIFQAQTIHGAAGDALTMVPVDKGGRPKQKALSAFITSLAAIFEKATGSQADVIWNYETDVKEKYEGPFYDFVRVCIEVIVSKEIRKKTSSGQYIKIKGIAPKEIRSNSSLGQAIKKALKSATSFPDS